MFPKLQLLIKMLTTVSAVQTINDKFKSILKKYSMQVTFDEIFIKSVLLMDSNNQIWNYESWIFTYVLLQNLLFMFM